MHLLTVQIEGTAEATLTKSTLCFCIEPCTGAPSSWLKLFATIPCGDAGP
jgi:hypothetical protein